MNLKALTQATTATILFITILTIASELSKWFHDFLGSLTGHHWVTKGVASILFFFLSYLLVSKFQEEADTKNSVFTLLATTAACGLIILGFFIWLVFFHEA